MEAETSDKVTECRGNTVSPPALRRNYRLFRHNLAGGKIEFMLLVLGSANPGSAVISGMCAILEKNSRQQHTKKDLMFHIVYY
jgi:hypothetical protein